MHNAVAMSIVQGASNLPCEFPRLLLLELDVADNVVEHLAAIDVFKHHVPVVRGSDDISHSADVWMINQTDNGGFAGGSDFLGTVMFVGSAMLFGCLSGDDFDGRL